MLKWKGKKCSLRITLQNGTYFKSIMPTSVAGVKSIATQENSVNFENGL